MPIIRVKREHNLKYLEQLWQMIQKSEPTGVIFILKAVKIKIHMCQNTVSRHIKLTI